tara:strand:- start:71 stop:946 length:876 start_codon:yes stop_codon:yes gene_type:complete
MGGRSHLARSGKLKLTFSKMHGAGNDFVVIDLVTQNAQLSAAQVRHIADRKRGIGCDQVLLVEPPTHPDADFRYRIFNADGSEAGQCGNGARCFGRFVREQQLTFKRTLKVQVSDGIMGLEIAKDDSVTADLGQPIFNPEQIPFETETSALEYDLDVAGTTHSIGAVSMGNPHAILRVESCDQAPVDVLGPAIESHQRFPERVNVGFMQIVNRQEIRLRVFERGAGETEACGTGACAAAIHGMRLGLLDRAVTVQLPGGKLQVRWDSDESAVWLGGPTASVFHGFYQLHHR